MDRYLKKLINPSYVPVTRPDNVGRPHTLSARVKLMTRVVSDDTKAKIVKARTGTTSLLATRLRMSETRMDHVVSAETRARIRRSMTGKLHAYVPRARGELSAGSGGAVGAAYAATLLPAGYVRERWVQWGETRYDRYRLDFAHMAAKVNIELDGPGHDASGDLVRDLRLRALGWRVIRIAHTSDAP
jgi:Protein of unknown function (DUF559)/NUMOD3 motif